MKYTTTKSILINFELSEEEELNISTAYNLLNKLEPAFKHTELEKAIRDVMNMLCIINHSHSIKF